MFTTLLTMLVGTANARRLRSIQPIVDKINSLESAIRSLSDAELSHKTIEFRERVMQGETLDDILPEAYAVVREAAARTLDQRPFDVQLVGAIAMHQGSIAEMKTGEGKTLTATLPLYLNALGGKSSHLVTVNDYLARRDAEWMSPIYTFLGMTVGILQNQMPDGERKKSYECDIIYATNSELGFDYLRDNMKFRLEDYVQSELNFAIVDEVDSILIDEARTPLIISGTTDEGSKLYVEASRVASKLKPVEDYEVDEKQRTVQLTESGNDKVEAALGIKNLYDVANINILHHITQALRAHVIYKRDVDYIVRDDEVLIVDEFTGRVLSGRRYSDGLHQAIEAKEDVPIERESQTLAAITLQNYFRLYSKLAGMTGTAATEAEEFYNIYKLHVLSVPTNMPMIRQDKNDLIFLTEDAKFKAVVADVKERHKNGQPVLIGTIAVEKSEKLSDYLKAKGVPHDILNAKNHSREAEIIASAGEPGRVTIATNMAGRGTDIKLTDDSRAAGGLYILGTERHESRRIDNQLRGRSGRQGDPGESRFYISLEDDLVRRFAGDSIQKNMRRWSNMTEDDVIEDKTISKIIEYAQEKIEKHNFDIRKNTLEYDDVLNQQRKVIYGYRREILEGQQQIYDLVRDLIISSIQTVFAESVPGRSINEEQAEAVYASLSKMTGLPLDDFKKENFVLTNSEILKQDIINFVLMKYDLYREQHKVEVVQEAERWLMLETIDQAWKQHMLNLDNLREGIGLRGYGQKNPLTEYKREAFDMFQDMMYQVRMEAVHHIFHLNLEHFDQHELEHRRERELEQLNFAGSDTGEGAVHQAVRAEEKVGRNDPCTCGSGKKYKKCHGLKE